jgi:hypothetical protein
MLSQITGRLNVGRQCERLADLRLDWNETVTGAYASGMQFPQWIIELAFPAQRYARRRRQAFFDERRRRHHLAQPQQVTADDADQADPDDEFLRARAQSVRDRRLARISTIARDQEELLRAKAEELERTGAAEISTADGQVIARLIRFRWGKDVLDLSRSLGGQPADWSLGTVPRSPAPERTANITSQLAQAVAAVEPPPPT